jgi:2-isopropylmalate synthase
VHTHNDRGTGVASTELALLAGAERVEGTLFGNGERTGNVDLVTVALNMYMQGVDPELDFSNIDAIREVYERTTRMTVPIRQPYAGELVFTAFSGSHQDAINKGMAAQNVDSAYWEVPYLPIDPQDIGRSYEAIIRINSQSGKGGVAYVLETEFGYQLPKAMHAEIGKTINVLADERGDELTPREIMETFEREYLQREAPYALVSFQTRAEGKEIICTARLQAENEEIEVSGRGNGPVNAFVNALNESGLTEKLEIMNFSQHSLDEGADARAVAYVQVRAGEYKGFGAAVATSVEAASIRAVISAANRVPARAENLLESLPA